MNGICCAFMSWPTVIHRKDQELKLAVRDALIPQFGEISAGAGNAQEVEDNIRSAEHTLIRTAEETLRRFGAEYPVRVEIDDFSFPETSDSRYVLSPGEYRTVRVVIGEGRGRNWWCVLFPPLSLSEEGAGVSVAAVSSQHVNRDGVPIEVRWRFLPHLTRIIWPVWLMSFANLWPFWPDCKPPRPKTASRWTGA